MGLGAPALLAPFRAGADDNLNSLDLILTDNTADDGDDFLSGGAGGATDALIAAEDLAAQTGMMGILAGAKSLRGLIALEAGKRDTASDLFEQAKAAVAPLNWLALEQKINVAASHLGGVAN